MALRGLRRTHVDEGYFKGPLHVSGLMVVASVSVK